MFRSLVRCFCSLVRSRFGVVVVVEFRGVPRAFQVVEAGEEKVVVVFPSSLADWYDERTRVLCSRYWSTAPVDVALFLTDVATSLGRVLLPVVCREVYRCLLCLSNIVDKVYSSGVSVSLSVVDRVADEVSAGRRMCVECIYMCCLCSLCSSRICDVYRCFYDYCFGDVEGICRLLFDVVSECVSRCSRFLVESVRRCAGECVRFLDSLRDIPGIGESVSRCVECFRSFCST